MILKFYWETVLGQNAPFCVVSSVSETGFAPIVSLLTDNGGISTVMDAEWIADGISKADAVLGGELAHDTWDRDTLFVKLNRETSVMDACSGSSKYHQVLNTDDFRRVLAAWHQFILDGPSIGAEVKIEIADR